MYSEHRRDSRSGSPAPPTTPSTPTPVTPKTYPFAGHALSPISSLHTILGKKANRSSSLSQVVNYFDSSPSLSDHSISLLDSPLRRADQTPKQHTSFYNQREASESETDSDEDDEYLRDESPELAEKSSGGIRPITRGSKGYIGPKRWPERLKGSISSGSSGMRTGGSNSTTSLTGPLESIGRQGSPEFISANGARGSASDIGSEDIPLRGLSVSRNDSFESRIMSPFPKSLQRIAATLAEESAPTESEMKREGMLYRYLRDYTPSSPMNSPLDAISYDMDPEEETIDTQGWWTEQSSQQNNSNNPPSCRDSSPSVDPMDTYPNSTRGHSVPPIPIPEITTRRPSTSASINGNEQMPASSTNNMGSMPPPMVPQLARMKRKAADYGGDTTTAIKRRAVSPSSSPLLSPIAIGGLRERRVLNIQDTHNGLEKMSLQD